MVVVLGIALTVLGVILLLLDFWAYARKRLTEGFGLLWGLLAVILLTAGIVLIVDGGATKAIWIVVIVLIVFLAMFLFGLSQSVSVLLMKNQELAMQVSLLNQENESILQDLNEMKERQDG